jgi:hypothetical protein
LGVAGGGGLCQRRGSDTRSHCVASAQRSRQSISNSYVALSVWWCVQCLGNCCLSNQRQQANFWHLLQKENSSGSVLIKVTACLRCAWVSPMVAV